MISFSPIRFGNDQAIAQMQSRLDKLENTVHELHVSVDTFRQQMGNPPLSNELAQQALLAQIGTQLDQYLNKTGIHSAAEAAIEIPKDKVGLYSLVAERRGYGLTLYRHNRFNNNPQYWVRSK